MDIQQQIDDKRALVTQLQSAIDESWGIINAAHEQILLAKSHMDTMQAEIAELVLLLPPPPPLHRVIPFTSPFTKIKNFVPDSAGKLLQKFKSADGAWEAMAWENRKPVTFELQPDGSVIVTVIDDSGSFTYVTLCPEDSGMEFGDRVLHFKQTVTYHLTARRINAWYCAVNSDDDLINTRVLSENVDPFVGPGIVIFMTDQRWEVRAYNTRTEVFMSDKWGPHFPGKHGFEGTPYRVPSHVGPSTPKDPKHPENWYTPYDQGGPETFGLTHPVEFFISKKRIVIKENGFTKVDLPCNLAFDKIDAFMPAIGTYHLANDINGDLKNQEKAGNGREEGYFALGMKDRRQFGPVLLEVLDAMPDAVPTPVPVPVTSPA